MEENKNFVNEDQQVILNEGYAKTISVGEWIWTLILMAIPLANIIVLIVWSFDESTNKTKSNWARAQLILLAIGAIIYTAFWVLFGAAIFDILSTYS